MGFTAITLRRTGHTRLAREAIGVALTTTTLPYSFKWCGLRDRRVSVSSLRPAPVVIVFAQLMMALTIGSLIAIPD